MLKNLFYFIDKLDLLKPETPALWGKMTARHMVEHLISAVQMGNGKLSVECFNSLEKLPGIRDHPCNPAKSILHHSSCPQAYSLKPTA